MKITIGEFKTTGINEVGIDLVVKKWNHLWSLAEWRRDNSWRIVKQLRKDSPISEIKITISAHQAKEIIKRLDLVSFNVVFKSAFSWMRQEDISFLEEWRRNKHSKAS